MLVAFLCCHRFVQRLSNCLDLIENVLLWTLGIQLKAESIFILLVICLSDNRFCSFVALKKKKDLFKSHACSVLSLENKPSFELFVCLDQRFLIYFFNVKVGLVSSG